MAEKLASLRKKGGGGTSNTVYVPANTYTVNQWNNVCDASSSMTYVTMYCRMPNYNNYLIVYFWDIKNNVLKITDNTQHFEYELANNELRIYNGKLQYKPVNTFFTTNAMRFIVSA